MEWHGTLKEYYDAEATDPGPHTSESEVCGRAVHRLTGTAVQSTVR